MGLILRHMYTIIYCDCSLKRSVLGNGRIDFLSITKDFVDIKCLITSPVYVLDICRSTIVDVSNHRWVIIKSLIDNQVVRGIIFELSAICSNHARIPICVLSFITEKNNRTNFCWRIEFHSNPKLSISICCYSCTSPRVSNTVVAGY